MTPEQRVIEALKIAGAITGVQALIAHQALEEREICDQCDNGSVYRNGEYLGVCGDCNGTLKTLALR
jgi:ribosomal protein L37AE/L43A